MGATRTPSVTLGLGQEMTRVGEFQLDKVAPEPIPFLFAAREELSKIIKSILYCPDYMVSISNAHLGQELDSRPET